MGSVWKKESDLELSGCCQLGHHIKSLYESPEGHNKDRDCATGHPAISGACAQITGSQHSYACSSPDHVEA